MAFAKHNQRILSGSLNLLPPPDKVEQPDSVVLQNWRVDQAGCLRSRKGSTVLNGALPGKVHSLFRVGTTRYVGTSTAIRTGSDASTSLDTGYDGNPVSFAAFQNCVWIMNRGRQRVTGGLLPSGTHPWPIVAPATAPSVAAGAEQSAALVEFDSAESWGCVKFLDNTAEVNPSGALLYDTSNKISGTHSAHVVANPAAKWQLRKDSISPAKDLRFSGVARDDDQLRLWFYNSDPSKITSIVVVLFCGAEPRGTVTAWIDPAILKQTTYQWNELRISRRIDPNSVVTSDPGYKELLVQIQQARERGDSAQEQALEDQRANLWDTLVRRRPLFQDSYVGGTAFDWSNVNGMVVEVVNTEPIDWHCDVAAMLGGDAGSLEGEYQYAVSYGNEEGHESMLGPYSAAITVQKKQVSVTSIPVSADPQVTVKYLYRVGGPLDRPLRIKELLNATTSVTDDISNDQAQNLNLAAQLDVDPPPAARGMLGPVQGRLVAWSSTAHKNRLWYTPVAQPWKWPGSTDEFEGYWFDVGQDFEEILAVTEYAGILRVYKEKTIHRIVGNLDDATPVQTAAKTAPVGSRAVCAAAGGSDYFVGPRGVYRFDGQIERKVSWKINPIFEGDWADIGGTYVPPVNRAAQAEIVCEYKAGQLWVSYPETGQTTPTVTLIYDEEGDRWSCHKLGNGIPGPAFTALYYEGSNGDYLAGTNGGALYKLEDSLNDAGAAIPLVWQSAMFAPWGPDASAVLGDLVVDAQTGVGAQTPATLTVKLILDDGTVVTLGTISTVTRPAQPTVYKLNGGLGYELKRFAVRLECNTSNAEVLVHGVHIHWYPLARTGQTFDTGVIELAPGRVAQLKQIDLDWKESATVSALVHSDLPGDVVAQRYSGSLGHVDGRRSESLVYPAVIEGRRHRIVLHNTGTMQIFRARALIRRIGEWMDGANGEYWSSGPFSPYGIHVCHLVEEIELDLDTDAAATLSILSEIPGSNQASRQSWTVNTETTTTGRRPWNERTVPIRGQILEVRLAPSGVCRLFGGRIKLRGLGGAYDWQWVPLPGIRQSDQAFDWVELAVDITR
jgi:hypothetical protein